MAAAAPESMIIFENVTAKVAPGRKNRTGLVLSSVNLRIPSHRHIAIVGSSQSHKNMLIDLISGMKLPAAGRIIRRARVSFPVGTVPGVEQTWSLRLNTAHVARLYGQDERKILRFVQRIYRLGGSFRRTYGELSQEERKRFARILAFSIPFDTYLVDDERMSEDCQALFEARMQTSGMIVNIHSNKFAKEFCDSALVVEDGRLQLIRNAEDVISGRLADLARRKRDRPGRLAGPDDDRE